MSDDKTLINIKSSELLDLPILPLRDVVVFPYMIIPLFVGRKESIKALQAASQTDDKMVFLVTQKVASTDKPKSKDLYRFGTEATILQLLQLPDGTIKALVEGKKRAEVKQFIDEPDYLTARIISREEALVTDLSEKAQREIEVILQSVLSLFEKYVKLNKKIPSEVINSINNIKEVSRLIDTIASHLQLKLPHKQTLLEIYDLKKRLEKLLSLINAEIDLLRIEKRLRDRIEKQTKKAQHEYYLREKLKAIEKELGLIDNAMPNEIEDLKKKIKRAGMTKEASEKAMTELSKLRMTPPMSAEATVIRNYLDVLLNVPWKKESKEIINLDKAEKILNDNHSGLEKIKERCLEYLAILKRVKVIKGPILCLVGPPGVGKTSLGQSIAKATGRKFIRISLGGVRDEAEIRGHRRTYIGSMPGKIMQKVSKISVKNPLFLLDEIDKMAMDFRGDPASALLEVLDPEQNNAFNDHYLEVDYDLSSVMFIATANTLNIPPPLLDRMEIIRISGYTEDEKICIALQHLLKKQLDVNGLKKSEIKLGDNIIRDIVRYYTREAGVRNLEREIAKLCRKVVKEILQKKVKKITVDDSNLEDFLGVKQYRYGIAEKENQIGQVTGLAWTEVGGELLQIESVAVSGKGKAILTGQLGKVMQESIQAAMTVVKSHGKALGLASKYFEQHDIHIHLPEGAIPKDGPSAGIGICTAVTSMATETPVRADLAMTGEITLRGEVLPIGGLKEKLLAALRGGITEVLIPEENKKDLKEIPENVKTGLKISSVSTIDQVFEKAFVKPIKLATKVSKTVKKTRKKSTGGSKS